jgi:hypothetical protein
MNSGYRLTISLALLTLPAVLITLYAGAYLLLGEWHETALVYCRAYRTAGEARVFKPAAVIESWLTGRQVATWVLDPAGGVHQP